MQEVKPTTTAVFEGRQASTNKFIMTSATPAVHLPVPLVWTQHVGEVYVTAAVVEPTNVVVTITDESITIECAALPLSSASPSANTYRTELKLFEPIDAALSQTYIITTRGVRLRLKKRKAAGSERENFWPRLTRDKLKLAHLTIDWNTWKDEDELMDQADKVEQGQAFSEMMGFKMEGGITLNGKGDPSQIAELLEREKRKLLSTASSSPSLQ